MDIDTNWCTFCDNAINPYSNSLYCSEECLRQDALSHHPMLGYDYSDLKNFPLQKKETHQPSIVLSRKPSIIPAPSLSSSISSLSSCDDEDIMPTSYFHPKPQRIASSIPLIERLNQAIIGL